MKRYIYFLFLLFVIKAKAQPPCATTEQYEYLMAHNPEYAALMNNRDKLASKQVYLHKPTAGPDTIPVVVHVISPGAALGTTLNPSDATIADMINSLNLSFSATYPNYPDINTGGVDVGIFFKLAMTSPSCQLTNGIVRINAAADAAYANDGVQFGGGTGGITHTQLAAKSFWDNTKYLNIWIVNKFTNSYYAGYAYFPSGTQTTHDGIVITSGNISGPYVIAHEAGHWLNLYHTFQGQYGSNCPENNNCLVDGDKVCDTPPVLINSGSPTSINPCNNQPYGFIGSNYMSYESHDRFTPLQKDRMRSALFTYRTSILNADTELPPPQAPTFSISSDDVDNIVCLNQQVAFSAGITGSPTQVTYQWFKNNVQVATNPTYSLNDLSDADEISCSIIASAPPCYTNISSTSNIIRITVPIVNAAITINNNQLSTPYHPQSEYIWNLNGQPIPGSNNYQYDATLFGSYTVTETNATCSRTSAPVNILPVQGGNTVLVFPNPFRDVLNAQTSDPEIKITSFRLFSSDGKLLERKSVDNYNIVGLSFLKYPAGMYVVEFNTTRGRNLLKVVKK